MTRFPETVPADDRGLAYGDGCFETLRLAGGVAPLAARHRRRMAETARHLGIPFHASAWEAALARLIREAPQPDGVVKIILTRGSGGRGYRPPPEPRPRLLASWHPFSAPAPALVEQGLVTGIAAQRLAGQPALAGLKHLNRLEQVLARGEAARRGLDEALMLDTCGRPLEFTGMNLFAVCAGELLTPPLARAGVRGVMRGVILESVAPSLGLPVREKNLTLAALRQADEVFACNSVVGVLPVRKLDVWSWPVGDLTRRLRAAVDSLFSA